MNQGIVDDSSGTKVSTQKLPSGIQDTAPVDGKTLGANSLANFTRGISGDAESCSALGMCLAEDVPFHAAFRQRFLSEFLYCYLPDSVLAETQDGYKAGASWMVQVMESTMRTKALETSMLSLCTAKLGRLHNDPVLLNASLKCYTRALWELQKALWDPDLMYHDETLAACMTLSMYELLECPAQTHNGWARHFDGCERLVQLRGPEAHSSAMAHEIFIPFRVIAVSLFCSWDLDCLSDQPRTNRDARPTALQS